MSETKNYKLYVTNDEEEDTFSWVQKMGGENQDSNMQKIDKVLGDKSDHSKCIEVILTVDGWSEDSPYSQTLQIDEIISSEQNGILSSAQGITITPNPVPVDNVTGITVKAQLNGRVQLVWTDPAATKVTDGVTLATWASTKVVYKTGSYPTSPEDGTLALNSTTRNAHTSSPLEVIDLTNGTTYYFAFFPVTTEGAVNKSTTQRITATPNKTKITTVPSQSSTLTYDGTAKTPTFSNYNSAQLTLSVTAQTNAGTYKATFTPKADYCWSDDSTTAKEVSWTIGKAAGSLSLNKTEVTLNTDKLSDTVTVTRAGDGVISATSSDTSVATVSVSGNIITVNHVNKKSGTATITVKLEKGADKKEWVLAMVKSSADTINYDVNMDEVGALIDSLCDMSKVINAPKQTEIKTK